MACELICVSAIMKRHDRERRYLCKLYEWSVGYFVCHVGMLRHPHIVANWQTLPLTLSKRLIAC